MRRPTPVPASSFSAVAAMSLARRRRMPPDSAAVAQVEVDPAVVVEADLAGEAAVVGEAASVAEAGVAVLVAVEAVALRKAGSSAIAGRRMAFTAWCSSI